MTVIQAVSVVVGLELPDEEKAFGRKKIANMIIRITIIPILSLLVKLR